MAIDIIDGFNVNKNVPIDTNRTIKSTIAERDAIPMGVRYEGMETRVIATKTKYVLEGGIANANWKPMVNSSIPDYAFSSIDEIRGLDVSAITGAVDVWLYPNKVYEWDAFSVVPDNGDTVLKPILVAEESAGRFILRAELAVKEHSHLPNESDFNNGLSVEDGKVGIGGELTRNTTLRSSTVLFDISGLSLNDGDTGLYDGIFKCAVTTNDGSTLIGGEFTYLKGHSRPFYNIVRLKNDGSVDADFFLGVNGIVENLYKQKDGKIVMVGDFTRIIDTQTERDFYTVSPTAGTTDIGFSSIFIARLNEDLSIDHDFIAHHDWGFYDPENPATATNLFAFSGSSLNYIGEQTDGKLVVLGNISGYDTIIDGVVTSYSYSKIARLNVDGSIDTTFINVNLPLGYLGLQIDEQDRIYVYGSFTAPSKYLLRINPNGGVDLTFSPLLGTGFSSTVRTMYLLEDGGFLIGGTFTTYKGVSCTRIAKLNSSFELDTAFTANRLTQASVYDIKRLSDGSFLACGAFTFFLDGADDVDFYEDTTYTKYVAKFDINGVVSRDFNLPFTSSVRRIVPIHDGVMLFNSTVANIQRPYLYNANGETEVFCGIGWSIYIEGFSIQELSEKPPESKSYIRRDWAEKQFAPKREYSLKDHRHDELYAAKEHDHDDRYELIGQYYFPHDDGRFIQLKQHSVLTLTESNNLESLSLVCSLSGCEFKVNKGSTTQVNRGNYTIKGNFYINGFNSGNAILSKTSTSSPYTYPVDGQSYRYVYDVIQLSDGTFFLVGNFIDAPVGYKLFQKRFADGTLDLSYSIGTANFSPGKLPARILRLSNGKYIIAGLGGTVNGFAVNGLIRLNADFSFDSSFNSSNVISYESYTDDLKDSVLVYEHEGKILLAGGITSVNGNSAMSKMVSFDMDGNLLGSTNLIVDVNHKIRRAFLLDDSVILAGHNNTTGIPVSYCISKDGTLLKWAKSDMFRHVLYAFTSNGINYLVFSKYEASLWGSYGTPNWEGINIDKKAVIAFSSDWILQEEFFSNIIEIEMENNFVRGMVQNDGKFLFLLNTDWHDAVNEYRGHYMLRIYKNGMIDTETHKVPPRQFYFSGRVFIVPDMKKGGLCLYGTSINATKPDESVLSNLSMVRLGYDLMVL